MLTWSVFIAGFAVGSVSGFHHFIESCVSFVMPRQWTRTHSLFIPALLIHCLWECSLILLRSCLGGTCGTQQALCVTMRYKVVSVERLGNVRTMCLSADLIEVMSLDNAPRQCPSAMSIDNALRQPTSAMPFGNALRQCPSTSHFDKAPRQPTSTRPLDNPLRQATSTRPLDNPLRQPTSTRPLDNPLRQPTHLYFSNYFLWTGAPFSFFAATLPTRCCCYRYRLHIGVARSGNGGERKCSTVCVLGRRVGAHDQCNRSQGSHECTQADGWHRCGLGYAGQQAGCDDCAMLAVSAMG